MVLKVILSISRGTFSDFMDALGYSSLSMGFITFVLFSVILIGIIGLWLGKKWGWWLITGYYINTFFSHSYFLMSLSDYEDVSLDLVRSQIISSSVKIILSIIIISFLMRKNISIFIGFKMPLWKRVIIISLALLSLSISIGILLEFVK
jgi:hypothetical protein